MIHIAETLSIRTVEGFIKPDEIERLNLVMDDTLGPLGRDRYGASRHTTIHEIPGHSPAEAQGVYEPAGRIEMTEIPHEATALLDQALELCMAAITRTLPSVTGHRPWIYLEYGSDQYITPHADGIAPDPLTRPRQIAAATVTLTDIQDTGGAFYVETTGSDAVWTADKAPTGSGYAPGMRFAHEGTDMSSPWFRSMPRTRWNVAPSPGTLVVFGSQLVHGTEPVRTGRVRKFLTLFVSE
ncbi:2OG-Fe(II) oxygenase [Streptomyces sp. WMMC940]|uniref:2OG-Fe(II) oxygenase n=1 Tax=Streptomyces sp. WMMC940 TaxID=3015153 RepID=UPI0022B70021|nr:2OG-Fe(II) oxygenase [Streptomyces sp. WMMC940]MCZ7460580.1 2OG-Fe(II) oxygenase [Streptomyces sp. WMMC940]